GLERAPHRAAAVAADRSPPPRKAERVVVAVSGARKRDRSIGTAPEMPPYRIDERQRTLEREDTFGRRVGDGRERRKLELACDDEIAEAMAEHLGALRAAAGRAFV